MNSLLPVLGQLDAVEATFSNVIEGFRQKKQVFASFLDTQPFFESQTEAEGSQPVPPPAAAAAAAAAASQSEPEASVHGESDDPDPRDTASINRLFDLISQFKKDFTAEMTSLVNRHYKIDLSDLFACDIGRTIASFQPVDAKTLCSAVGRSSPEDVCLLLQVGAQVDGLHEGKTALMRAVSGGKEAITKMLVQRGEADLGVTMRLHDDEDDEEEDETGRTALHLVCGRRIVTPKQVEIARFLLSEGADPNAADEDDEFTPLHEAAYHGHSAMIDLLVSFKADVNAKDNEGAGPLSHAVIGNCIEAAQRLIAHGAKVNQPDEEGMGPLHFTVIPQGSTLRIVETEEGEGEGNSDRKEMAELLLDHGADVNMADEGGKTILHHAALRGAKGVVEVALSRGADVHLRDAEGRTALHSVCFREYETSREHIAVTQWFRAQPSEIKSHWEVARLLICHGVDLQAVGEHGKTAMQLSKRQRLLGVVGRTMKRYSLARLFRRVEKGGDVSNLTDDLEEGSSEEEDEESAEESSEGGGDGDWELHLEVDAQGGEEFQEEGEEGQDEEGGEEEEEA
uniref:Uncharacterized protein n=1 Tax=Chromera velia CCMP2878 TaxID=1169474 RepID=A0A0G4HF05_9ALVE|eukprot:Cvel_26748.t1-p1 / transcript=Cvel_26748.t1 / gene=Cvel_26748 / organism=Chromera_velia_CCMP2878 / gene_product=Ankyrin repeat domain-containing protein 50, putative / transcript_product=Ankyrin repeat domain-containing protein 50, putative / location=Cvel_scaffold3230:16368-18068(-) / protein_length=567 / sequence_SO=supercontig / SO=protein_coding / is_pseudo=false